VDWAAGWLTLSTAEVLVDVLDYGRACANGGRDPLDRSRPEVADREHPRDAGLRLERRPHKRPLPRRPTGAQQVPASQQEPARFGDTPLNKITRQAARVFAKDVKQRLAERTAADVMSLLGLLMREAVADRRIGFNPCQGLRVMTGHRLERTPATAEQINGIAERINRRSDQILVITAAYTGMRWGEFAGLAKPTPTSATA
jgi:integrase